MAPFEHCGKHDKNFNEQNPCPGCVTEAQNVQEVPDDLDNSNSGGSNDAPGESLANA